MLGTIRKGDTESRWGIRLICLGHDKHSPARPVCADRSHLQCWSGRESLGPGAVRAQLNAPGCGTCCLADSGWVRDEGVFNATMLGRRESRAGQVADNASGDGKQRVPECRSLISWGEARGGRVATLVPLHPASCIQCRHAILGCLTLWQRCCSYAGDRRCRAPGNDLGCAGPSFISAIGVEK
jgi:hypothetical protein